MKSNKVYLGLGTNLGNREENLHIARQLIEEKIGVIILQSSIYETAAWGLTEQNAFLNQVMCVETKWLPSDLLEQVLALEKSMGRIREIKWGARIIDLDILYYSNKVISTRNLVIPHPFLQERRFVLVPLCEIAGIFVHPVLKKTNLELLESCVDSGEVLKYNIHNS